MSRVFNYQRRVEFCETDAAGIVHFSAFLCYMEQAEHAFLRAQGLSVMAECGDDASMRLSWPRVKVECEYLGPAKFEDLLEITLRVVRLGSKSVTYGFEFHGPSGQQVARGQMVAVCCLISSVGSLGHNAQSLSPVEIPAAIRQVLSQFAT